MKTGDRREITPQDVKDANRVRYDAAAEYYERIDGRRSPALEAWLRSRLSEIRGLAPGGRLLDVCAGAGLVSRCASGVFDFRAATDISPIILAANRGAADVSAAADADRLPFRDNSFDAAVCFSALHHLYSFECLFAELARVIRPGGVFYSDHDMDAVFRRRFALPLSLYNKLRDSAAKYARVSEKITRELYEMTEWHEKGIDAPALARTLGDNGFSVELRFHWFGLSGVTDAIFKQKFFPRGAAPLISIVARKTEQR